MRSLQFVSLLILMCSLNCFAMEEEEQEDRLNQKLLDVSLAGSFSLWPMCFSSDSSQRMADLLNQGANIETTLADTGKTPLHLLAENGYVNMAEKLLERCDKGDINRKDTEGYTPLHYAALWLRHDIYTLLIKKGASKQITNDNGETAGQLYEWAQNRTWSTLFQKFLTSYTTKPFLSKY